MFGVFKITGTNFPAVVIYLCFEITEKKHTYSNGIARVLQGYSRTFQGHSNGIKGVIQGTYRGAFDGIQEHSNGTLSRTLAI